MSNNKPKNHKEENKVEVKPQVEVKPVGQQPEVIIEGINDVQAKVAKAAPTKSSNPRLNSQQPAKEQIDYSPERIAEYFGGGQDGIRVANRLSDYLTKVATANDLTTLSRATINVRDLVTHMGNMSDKQFIVVTTGLLNFFKEDLTENGENSALFGVKPFRPYMGTNAKEQTFLAFLLDLAVSSNIKHEIQVRDLSRSLPHFNPNRRELFRQVVIEM